MHDAFTGLVGRHDLRIIGLDGAGKHHRARTLDVFGTLPEFHGNAKPLQSLGFGARLAVGAVHVHALLMQHLGKHAHTGSADADEVGFPKIIHALSGAEGRMGWIKNNGTGITLVVRHDCSSYACFQAHSIMVGPQANMPSSGWPVTPFAAR